MEKLLAFVGLCLLAAPLLVQAHPKLLETTPAADSIAKSVAGVSLTFNQDVRLLQLSVTSENGDKLDTDFELTTENKKEYNIAVSNISKGKFTVSASVMGADGHAVNRAFDFIVE